MEFARVENEAGINRSVDPQPLLAEHRATMRIRSPISSIAPPCGNLRSHGSGAVSQLVLGRTAPWIGASAGSIALAAGMVLIVLAVASDSSATYLIGSILGGADFGIAFLGGLAH